MIYTVTIVDTSFVSPKIYTTVHRSIEKAVQGIRNVIDNMGERIANEEKVELESTLADLESNEFGDIVFDNAEIYINLDYHCNAY